jgi:hypothetical protein
VARAPRLQPTARTNTFSQEDPLREEVTSSSSSFALPPQTPSLLESHRDEFTGRTDVATCSKGFCFTCGFIEKNRARIFAWGAAQGSQVVWQRAGRRGEERERARGYLFFAKCASSASTVSPHIGWRSRRGVLTRFLCEVWSGVSAV